MMDKNFEYYKLMEYVMEGPRIILAGGKISFKRAGKKLRDKFFVCACKDDTDHT